MHKDGPNNFTTNPQIVELSPIKQSYEVHWICLTILSQVTPLCVSVGVQNASMIWHVIHKNTKAYTFAQALPPNHSSLKVEYSQGVIQSTEWTQNMVWP